MRIHNDVTNGIPSNDTGESTGIVARDSFRRDVMEAREAIAIQPGIQEAEFRSLVVIQKEDNPPTVCTIGSAASSRANIAEKRNQEGKTHWHRVARALHDDDVFLIIDGRTGHEVERLHGDVGIAAALSLK